MDTKWSDSYLVVERMIRESNVTALELRDLLITLESQGLITASEHAALLEQAVAAKLENMTHHQREGLPAVLIEPLSPGDRDHAAGRPRDKNAPRQAPSFVAEKVSTNV